MSYVDLAEKYLRSWGMITHRRIMQVTGCNCPYSVLAGLKKRVEFSVKEKKTTQGKRYNLYILKREGEDDRKAA